MAYRMVYLRVRCNGYDPGASGGADLSEFKTESRRLFREMGWMVHKGRSGVCDTVTKDRQDLYLHPASFSGVLEEANIPLLRNQLSGARSFQCYAVDCYEEYADLSDGEYRDMLEARRDEISAFILEQCRTKRANLYIVDPVADRIAEHFEVRRLSDRDRRNSIGKRFVSELVTQLLREGRLVAAETDCGTGIRSATGKELQTRAQSAEQVKGQITMIF